MIFCTCSQAAHDEITALHGAVDNVKSSMARANAARESAEIQLAALMADRSHEQVCCPLKTYSPIIASVKFCFCNQHSPAKAIVQSAFCKQLRFKPAKKIS